MRRLSRLFFYLRYVTATYPRVFGARIVNWFIDREERWLTDDS